MNTQNAAPSEPDAYEPARMFEAWGHAWQTSTHGVMVAGVEQLELAQALNSRAFDMMEKMAEPCSPQEMAEHWLGFMRPSFQTVLEGYRRINDELTRSFFTAAEGLTHSLAAAATSPEPEP